MIPVVQVDGRVAAGRARRNVGRLSRRADRSGGSRGRNGRSGRSGGSGPVVGADVHPAVNVRDGDGRRAGGGGHLVAGRVGRRVQRRSAG